MSLEAPQLSVLGLEPECCECVNMLHVASPPQDARSYLTLLLGAGYGVAHEYRGISSVRDDRRVRNIAATALDDVGCVCPTAGV